MTYPTEFYDQSVSAGATNITHPIYTFKVNLDIQATELIGPSTNQREVTVLHPDQYQTSPDYGRSQQTIRKLQNHSWFAALNQAGNLYVNDDGTITVYGLAGAYLNRTFTTGTYPLLTLTNSAPYTSA